MTTTDLINGIVGFVNETVITDPDQCEALLAFDDRAVPAPLTKFYFAFLIGQDKMNLIDVDTEECCQQLDITVSMNCYAPPGESALGVCAFAEQVLERVGAEYAGLMNGYEIGTAVIDDYLKALKIPCKLHFHYEQCPAFNITGSVLRPFADFFCRSHVDDESLHLSPDERTKLTVPFVNGTYTGLGTYNSVDVTLGFRPSVLFIFPMNAPAVRINSAYNVVLNYFDCVFPGVGNSCAILHSTGFTVAAAPAISSNTAQRMLNESGVTYGYVAWR